MTIDVYIKCTPLVFRLRLALCTRMCSFPQACPLCSTMGDGFTAKKWTKSAWTNPVSWNESCLHFIWWYPALYTWKGHSTFSFSSMVGLELDRIRLLFGFWNPQLHRMHDKDRAWMDNKGNLCFPFEWLDRNISSLTVIHQWMSTRRIIIHQIMSWLKDGVSFSSWPNKWSETWSISRLACLNHRGEGRESD